jgi:hypothetical protein
MLQRTLLLIASLAAALVLAAGLALAGFGPASPGSGAQAVDPVAEPAAATADTGAPLEAVQVDTVYLKPAPTPEVIVTKVVQTKAAHHDDENEHEGSDD